MQTNNHVIYQPDESLPHLMALGHGLQATIGWFTGVAASTAIIVQATGQSDGYLHWIFFVSLIACGLGTICQTLQVWRFGSGYPLTVSNGLVFIPVCISALVAGGPAMLSTLIVVSALVQFFLASRLRLLRRILTPTVTGTVLMLLAATVITVLFNKVSDTPEGTSPAAALVVVVVTAGVIIGLQLFGPYAWRQWSRLIGILTGCALSIPLGLISAQALLSAD